MKTIGLVGGTGWVSTADYYKLINEETNKRLGGMEFAKCILYSFNYGEIYSYLQKDDYESINEMVLKASQKLIVAGAEFIILGANTVHMFADDVRSNIDVPLIHIAEATAKEINKSQLSKVILLGTKYTMEMDFYKTKLKSAGIETVIPDNEERQYINNSIFEELLKDNFRDETRARYVEIIDGLIKQGAEGVVLGCTEIPLLVKAKDVSVPIFNTTELHANVAVDFALS